jgi:hypothetical protein
MSNQSNTKKRKTTTIDNIPSAHTSSRVVPKVTISHCGVPNLAISRPGVPKLASSAHLTSSASQICDKLPVVIVEKKVNDLDLFFHDVAAVNAKVEIRDNLQAALKNDDLPENDLRYAIHDELKHQGVPFPASEIKDKEEYTEAELFTLLYEWYQTLEIGVQYKKEEDFLHGLLVPTSSKPDLTVCRENTMLFGEIKNCKAYKNSSALSQCAVYLAALLYFIRVRMGVAVESVFGFFVCGCCCHSSEC